MGELLGPRLQAVAAYVPAGSRLGDIGTDHGYLLVDLLQRGVIKSAVGVDVHRGPWETARQAAERFGLTTDRLKILLGDGLSPLRPGEVDTLTLAGMGGNTILDILAAGPAVLRETQTLVLQPQGAEGKLRRSLAAAGWQLAKETLVEENNRIYAVIQFVREGGFSFSDGEKEDWEYKLFWQFGPLILEKKGPLLHELMMRHLASLERILALLAGVSGAAVTEKRRNLAEEKKILEEYLRCLYP